MITLTHKNIKAEISLTGGELISLYKGEKNILWCRDAKFWGSSAPLLFPICGRLREGVYTLKGKTYTLSAHGFARDMTFTVREQSVNAVTLAITDNETTQKSYPFSFDFAVNYTLNDAGLCVTFTVTNKGETLLPYSLGGHWGFALEGDITEYALRFESEAPKVREVLDGAYISGKVSPLPSEKNILPLSYHICDNDTWVIRDAPRVCTLTQKGEDVLRLEYPDTPHLLIWTKPNAPYVCIEPWNGMPDGKESGEITDKDSIRHLSAGEKEQIIHRILFY